MQPCPMRTGVRYLAAVAIIAATFAVRRLLDPLIGVETPFNMLMAGVMASAFLAGRGPGVVATLIAALAADFFYLEPRGTILGNGWHDLHVAIFVGEGLFISWLVGVLRDSFCRSAESERRLAESDRRKDEFLAILAHELRNPLAPLSHALRLLRNPRATDEMKQQAQATMQRQVELIVRLVDDLLDLSRIARGKLEMHFDDITLEDVVSRAVEISRPLIESRRHRLIVRLPEEPLRLHADPLRMTQVFCNLLNNAAKFTPEGGEIRVTAEMSFGGKIVVKVADTGIGIPADKLSRLFELFEQIERTAVQSQGGLGLGLALSRGIIERHGGTIRAYSDGPNQGSRFVVRLPSARRAADSRSDFSAAPQAERDESPSHAVAP